jgi:hypothetical protein
MAVMHYKLFFFYTETLKGDTEEEKEKWARRIGS